MSIHTGTFRGVAYGATLLLIAFALNSHGAPRQTWVTTPTKTASRSATPLTLPSTCPTYVPVATGGRIASATLIEASGLAVSAKNRGVVWAHNDSGGHAHLYAMTTIGADLGRYTVRGATLVDWEDMAIGPGPREDTSYLYVADTGANDGAREFVSIYRIEEPVVHTAQKPMLRELRAVSRFDLTYSDRGSWDSEALMVDPLSADVYLVTKPRTGFPVVFRAKAPLPPSPRRGTLDPIATLTAIGSDWFFPALVTAADMSRDGKYILVRTYLRAYLWQRVGGETVEAAFKRDPCPMPLGFERQGEAIAFTPDGQGYYSTSEGPHPMLLRFQRQ